jgi:hypothetical protein
MDLHAALGILEGAFDAPDNAGWLYNYQTLVGVLAALAGAAATIAMTRREQRQQREHFEKQMDIMNRPDRLRVSRETARLIPALRGGLAEVKTNATLAVAPYRGAEMRSQRLIRILKELSETLDQQNFVDLLSLLDDDFTDLRASLELRVRQIEERWLKAFAALQVTDEKEIEILGSNDLVQLAHVGLRHDESWRVLQGHLKDKLGVDQ